MLKQVKLLIFCNGCCVTQIVLCHSALMIGLRWLGFDTCVLVCTNRVSSILPSRFSSGSTALPRHVFRRKWKQSEGKYDVLRPTLDDEFMLLGTCTCTPVLECKYSSTFAPVGQIETTSKIWTGVLVLYLSCTVQYLANGGFLPGMTSKSKKHIRVVMFVWPFVRYK
jgi:hypothetical protein